jgi:hypothetical protein
LNRNEFCWRPKWAQPYRDAVDEHDLEVNNFDGLLLAGWKVKG